MKSFDNTPHQQELNQLLEAYSAIRDDRARYFISMMLQCVALALTEARQENVPAKLREKQRARLAA